ncbi:MAG: hypothetical protein ACREPM_05975, partial [Gemmatimonadaceae bacterium]
MMTVSPGSLRSAAFGFFLAGLGACGGAATGDGGAITTPPDKTCQQDPTQAKCATTTTPRR